MLYIFISSATFSTYSNFPSSLSSSSTQTYTIPPSTLLTTFISSPKWFQQAPFSMTSPFLTPTSISPHTWEIQISDRFLGPGFYQTNWKDAGIKFALRNTKKILLNIDNQIIPHLNVNHRRMRFSSKWDTSTKRSLPKQYLVILHWSTRRGRWRRPSPCSVATNFSSVTTSFIIILISISRW